MFANGGAAVYGRDEVIPLGHDFKGKPQELSTLQTMQLKNPEPPELYSPNAVFLLGPQLQPYLWYSVLGSPFGDRLRDAAAHYEGLGGSGPGSRS